jgi:hypothetical protein
MYSAIFTFYLNAGLLNLLREIQLIKKPGTLTVISQAE